MTFRYLTANFFLLHQIFLLCHPHSYPWNDTCYKNETIRNIQDWNPPVEVHGFDELQKFLMKSRWIGRWKSLNGRLEFSERVFRRMKKKTYAIVNTSFHNAKFSDRIWMYQDMMNAELSKLLQQGLIRGKHPRDLARHLKKLFGVNQYNKNAL